MNEQEAPRQQPMTFFKNVSFRFPRGYMKLAMPLIAILVTAIQPVLSQGPFHLAQGKEPAFLVPPSINENLEYEMVLNEKLLSRYGRGQMGTMLAMPAFEPEYCVSIYEVPSSTGKNEFIATSAKTSRNLHGWLQERNRGEQGSGVEVIFTSRKISPELAIAFQRLWARSILLSRYPNEVPPPVRDGVRYRFSVLLEIGEISGETYSPSGGLCLDLANIGQSLFSLVMGEGSTAKNPEFELTEKIRILEKSLL